MFDSLDSYVGPAAGITTSVLLAGTAVLFPQAAQRLGAVMVDAVRLAIAIALLAVTHRLAMGLRIPPGIASPVTPRNHGPLVKESWRVAREQSSARVGSGPEPPRKMRPDWCEGTSAGQELLCIIRLARTASEEHSAASFHHMLAQTSEVSASVTVCPVGNPARSIGRKDAPSQYTTSMPGSLSGRSNSKRTASTSR